MNLYILRHAIAEEIDTKRFSNDSERPLTSEGKRKMMSVAKGMKALDLSFDVIVSSPFVRAKQTAEIVTQVFKAKRKLKLSPNLAVGGDPEDLIEELKLDLDSIENVLLVGHEPYLSQLISLLLTGDSSLSLEMKKAGLCKLYIDVLQYGHCATLEWLMTPGQLSKLC
jgi:phosphohistidine phosphatase